MYRPYEAALPQVMAPLLYTWNVSWENGKLKPIQETESPGVYWQIQCGRMGHHEYMRQYTFLFYNARIKKL